MLYSGKYIDLFESAMQILFVEKGFGMIPYLDIMGKRCFGFRNRNDGKGYYVPIICIQEALEEIACYTHLEQKLTVWNPECLEEIMEYAMDGIVYGPIKKETGVRQIKTLYYHGENRYVYIQADPEGRYYITDPDGFPAIYYSESEMHSFLCGEEGVIIHLTKNDGDYRQIVDGELLWKDGWKFQESIVEGISDTTMRPKAFEGYDGSASSRIVLWYGVINFVQNMEKLWCFKSELGKTESDSNFNKLMCEILETAENGEVDKLPQIEAAVWKEISDGI